MWEVFTPVKWRRGKWSYFRIWARCGGSFTCSWLLLFPGLVPEMLSSYLCCVFRRLDVTADVNPCCLVASQPLEVGTVCQFISWYEIFIKKLCMLVEKWKNWYQGGVGWGAFLTGKMFHLCQGQEKEFLGIWAMFYPLKAAGSMEQFKEKHTATFPLSYMLISGRTGYSSEKRARAHPVVPSGMWQCSQREHMLNSVPF